MEYDNQDVKLGGGIITICVLHFIGLVLTMLSLVGSFIMKDQLAELGISSSSIIIGAFISVLISIGAVLILLKSKIGIILYYIGALGNLISSIVLNGFTIMGLVSALLLPVIMGILLNGKRELFGLENKN